jgi:transposase
VTTEHAQRIDDLRAEIARLRAERERRDAEIAGLRVELRDLAVKNEWLTKVVFGQRTEKRRPPQDHGAAEQQELFAVPVAVGETAAEAEAQAAEQAQQDEKNRRKGRAKGGGAAKPCNGGGRKPVNQALRVIEQVIAAAPEDRIAADGTALVLTGYEISEREHFIPAEVVRLIIKREKWGLPDTRETVIRAPCPPSIVPRGKYSDDFIAEAMIRKYLHGLPFERQVADFATLGSDLTVSTLCDLAQRFAVFLRPVADAIRDAVRAAPFVHIDETPLWRQDGRKRYLWAAYAQRQVSFHYGGRGAVDLRAVLGLDERPPGTAPPGGWIDLDQDDDDPFALDRIAGIICADGLAAYDRVAEDHAYLRLGCWVHARREFLTHEKDPRARHILDLIAALYRSEKASKREAEKRGASPAESAAIALARRQAEARPILDQIKACIDEWDATIAPDDAIRGAVTYFRNQWPTLCRFLRRGDLPLDNNAAERAIRPVVIGRKNWLFVGSEDAGAHAATNFSVLESCRMAKLDARAYLRHVIAALHGGATDAAALTPAALRKQFPIKKQ